MPVSVLILTHDEEDNLPDCLASVAWSDDVVVLDSGSDDRTVALAEAGGAQVLTRPFDTFASQRNHGLGAVAWAHDWVLHLDADERVTPELQAELIRLATGSTPHDGYFVPSRLMFLGRWLKRAGGYPAYQMRFARTATRFQQVGHGQREQSGLSVGYVQQPLIHYSFSKGLEAWMEKHNRYSSAEARHEIESAMGTGRAFKALFAGDRVTRRRGLKSLTRWLPFRPTLRFLYLAVLKGGVLDGRAGLTYCRLIALYERMIVIKRAEAKHARRQAPTEGK